MLNNLLIMQIIIPLAGGLLSFLLPKRFSWLFATVIMLATCVISLLLFKLSLGSLPVFYNLGDWSFAIGIEYKLDKLNSFFMLLVSSLAFLNILAMRSLTAYEIDEEKYPLFFGLFLIAITGLLGIAISNDIFNIYVLLEVNAIASYALVASGTKKESKKAAFEYLIFGTIGSTLILFGIGFIYALVGSLNLTQISQIMPGLLDNNAAIAGITLIILGVLMKAALFPLSSWLVNIYQGAPSFVSSILASCSNKIGIYLLLRFFFDVFKLNQYSFEYLEIILLVTAMVAIFVCAFFALKQTNIKRYLAYSSLSQIGFIILSIALASKISISGALIYSLTHALEKTALFLAIGYMVSYYTNSEEIDDFAGLARSRPFISVLVIINLLSTVGIPLTAGFVGKWQILKATLASDIWYILIVSIAVLFTFSYIFKFVELLIIQKPKSEVQPSSRGVLCLGVITFMTMLNLYIGMNHQYLLDIVNQISQIMIKS
jgi:multicomponent Na+:H+ antiporter subunit D